MENKLPKYWIVKNDGSQLFKDTVVKYLNNNYAQYLEGNSPNAYYGYDGSKCNSGVDCCYNKKSFKNNPIELTLQEFIELSKKPMEIKYTKEYCKANKVAIVIITVEEVKKC